MKKTPQATQSKQRDTQNKQTNKPTIQQKKEQTNKQTSKTQSPESKSRESIKQLACMCTNKQTKQNNKTSK